MPDRRHPELDHDPMGNGSAWAPDSAVIRSASFCSVSTDLNEPVEPTAEREIVSASIRREDIARLEVAAERRGIGRDEVIAQAIDAFLARETWSGGFIAPPPPMEVPGPFPWKATTFRLWRR
jgi:hypothetical protein